MKEAPSLIVSPGEELSSQASERIERITRFTTRAIETMQVRDAEREVLRLSMAAWDVCPHPVAFIQGRTLSVYWNRAATEMLAFAELQESRFDPERDKFTNIEGERLQVKDWPMFRALSGEIVEKESVIWHKEGYSIRLSLSAFPVYERGQILGALLMFSESEPSHESQEAKSPESFLT